MMLEGRQQGWQQAAAASSSSAAGLLAKVRAGYKTVGEVVGEGSIGEAALVVTALAASIAA